MIAQCCKKLPCCESIYWISLILFMFSPCCEQEYIYVLFQKTKSNHCVICIQCVVLHICKGKVKTDWSSRRLYVLFCTVLYKVCIKTAKDYLSLFNRLVFFFLLYISNFSSLHWNCAFNSKCVIAAIIKLRRCLLFGMARNQPNLYI